MAKPGFKIEYQHDKKAKHKFKQTTPDDEWLSVVGQEGWIVFSHDRKFHQIEAECAAIKQHQIGCFYLWWNNAKTWEKLRCFMRAHDRILGAIGKNAAAIHIRGNTIRRVKGGQYTLKKQCKDEGPIRSNALGRPRWNKERTMRKRHRSGWIASGPAA